MIENLNYLWDGHMYFVIPFRLTYVYFSWGNAEHEIRQNFDELSTAWLIDICLAVKLVTPLSWFIAWKILNAELIVRSERESSLTLVWSASLL